MALAWLVAALGLLPLALWLRWPWSVAGPRPPWRSWPAPWALSALVYLSVQLSGGLASPALPALRFVGLFIWPVKAPGSSPWGWALLLSTLEALPLLALAQAEQARSPWPTALALAWPMLGVLAGWLSQGSQRSNAPARPAPRFKAGAASPRFRGHEFSAGGDGGWPGSEPSDAARFVGAGFAGQLGLGLQHPWGLECAGVVVG